MKFAKTKLAAAIAAATMASAANAVVVVGGDNGWEVSFDGNVNAFYTYMDQDNTTTQCTNAAGVGTACGVSLGSHLTAKGETSSRVHSGFLPAFFSFNVKSPTVNGLTGKARFSFAPTIQRNKSSNGINSDTSGLTGLTGATIDTREVLAAVDGSFGEVSFGRTLSIYGRQAILHDMTLFGVGNNTNNPDFGTVTAGRIGIGYLYPDFEARFAWASPAVNGFKLEVGAYDPTEPGGLAGGASTQETDTPRFEGELTYATTFTGGDVLLWVDGMWQSVQKIPNNAGATFSEDLTGVGGGANLNWNNFGLTGYYQQDDGTGLLFKFPGFGTGASILGSSFNCDTAGAVGVNGGVGTGANCKTSDQNEWYVQGTYTFGGKTKVGFSYGEANQNGSNPTVGTGVPFADVENSMWSIGVYHDMTSWLKLIAEYNNVDQENTLDLTGTGGIKTHTKGGYDSFSVGAFLTW
ncbi:MAG TPA: porin [Gammaproteobacteria bacterium]|nr:porin [Gammaproteobacteria bacterium]